MQVCQGGAVHPDRRTLDPSACSRLRSSLLLQVTSWIHFQLAGGHLGANANTLTVDSESHQTLVSGHGCSSREISMRLIDSC